jgi:hypothetical protein
MFIGITWGGFEIFVGVGEGVAAPSAFAPVKVPCCATLPTFFMI